ncbi:hypothetical protein SPRG_15209 [Saprolegnia parasitica CBS 223.65]|uniref:CBM1 domain-containing protein n=1 Tax=Saprolegnia parasitica (strain CBS 223.65) TaxID=695850 RepID=A0A067BKJ3_SAPPC|nr:hypothetical protein SPRG_15209 [Saprolegnia parasitica CBS 223.65]KDO18683.1 hypothetical protein SPRG_15209 [Saprolegnia parasitica CBS 223.65]|eukprot:XP_012210613.1 hypothetical protein SPRG_15209 [Saprolegnia parasitica CBS 223.65]
MLHPPHRGHMFRLPQFSFFPEDYDDDGLSGGGIGGTKGGKHGICGDPYNGARHHETGGKYGLFPKYGAKAVGACYKPGATMDIDIQITANHKGYFTFGLCKLNGKDDKETEECFQDLKQPNGETQWKLPGGNKKFSMQYNLPSNVKCDGDSHCVLRWWYVGWNNPDDDINGQEQFWNCADIYISDSCGSEPKPTQKPVPTDVPSPDDSNPTTMPTHKPTHKPTDKPTHKPNDKPTQKPTDKPTQKPTDKPTHKPNDKPTQKPIDVKDAKKAWEQCGGKDYTGNVACATGLECIKQDEWYSQCVPAKRFG